MKIRLNNSTDAKTVVSIANKFKDCDIDGSIGRCIIDLKSILGVLSFGLPKVICSSIDVICALISSDVSSTFLTLAIF